MSCVRAILEAEVASSTLVIHMDDRSTDFLKAIYEGRGYPVMAGRYTRDELRQAIESHDRVFMLGHGGPSGLFSKNFMIDGSFGPLLAAKSEGLYIWCNADAYAKRNGLSGLVSGMFISEVGEASMFGIRASQQEVDASNAAFSRIVRQHLDAGTALSNVRQCYTSAACKITQYNSERLYIFDHGNPTPALHQSSLAHPPPPRPERPPRDMREPTTRQSELAWPEAGEEEDLGPEFELEQEQWFRKLQWLMIDAGFNPMSLGMYDYQQLSDELMNYFYDGYSPEEAFAAVNQK
jgi:hypothetical protein